MKIANVWVTVCNWKASHAGIVHGYIDPASAQVDSNGDIRYLGKTENGGKIRYWDCNLPNFIWLNLDLDNDGNWAIGNLYPGSDFPPEKSSDSESDDKKFGCFISTTHRDCFLKFDNGLFPIPGIYPCNKLDQVQ